MIIRSKLFFLHLPFTFYKIRTPFDFLESDTYIMQYYAISKNEIRSFEKLKVKKIMIIRSKLFFYINRLTKLMFVYSNSFFMEKSESGNLF